MECSGHSARVARPGVSGRSEFNPGNHIRPKRPLRASRATVRFETAPGHAVTNMTGVNSGRRSGGIEQKVFIAVNTLGYSRRFHVWGTVSQDACASPIESRGTQFCVPGRGDRRRCWWTTRSRRYIAHRVGDRGRMFHPRFLDLAGHYGFVPKACRPYRARTKGKTERMVRYVKSTLFCTLPAV